MDANFVVLAFAMGSLILGHISHKKIWNILAIPAFFYLMVEYSSSIMMSIAFAFAMIVTLADMFFVGKD